MRTTLFTAMVAATLLALAGPTIADEPIVLGYNKIIVPKDADVVISVPFVNKAEATYTVASTSSPSVSVVEALPVSTYADGLYYVRFTTGNAKGFWSTISSNPAGQLVLEDDSFFAKIGDGDEFKVYKHQTLAGVFPANLEDFSMLASEKNPFLPAIQTFKTQVQIFDPNSAAALNKTPSDIFFFYDGAWRKLGGSLSEDRGAAVLRPGSYFLVRNINSDQELTVLTRGVVSVDDRARELVNGVADDVLATTGRPTAVTLKELNLGGTPAFVDSQKNPFLPAIQTFGDQLLVFDNTGSVLNRTPSAIYFYYDGAWRKQGSALSSTFDTVQISPSQGFIIRKGTALGSGTATWLDQASN